MSSAQRRWERVRQQILARATVCDDGPRAVILESWRRSRDAGVQTDGRVLLHRISLQELADRRSKNRVLLDTAIPMLDEFSNSKLPTKHVVYLADADGIILYSKGTDFMMQAYGLRPGFDWSEQVMGTNGAGTALACNAPVAVLGPEHWTLPFREASCMAAVIHNVAGLPLAAVDLSMNVSDSQADDLGDIIRLTGRIEAEFLRTTAARHQITGM